MCHLDRLDSYYIKLCCVLILCCAWQSAPPTERSSSGVDLTTPSNTIQSFIAAINNHNDLVVSKCVLGSKPSVSLDQLQRLDNLVYYHVEATTLSCRDLQVQINGENATVTLKFTTAVSVEGREFERSPAAEDRVILKRDGVNWKIVPAELASLETMLKKPAAAMSGRAVTFTAAVYAYPEIFAASRGRAIEVTCRQRMKLLCLLALEYLQDHDDVYGFKPVGYKNSLMPYYVKFRRGLAARVKGPTALFEAETRREIELHCPLDAKGETGFAFNANLYQLADVAIVDPAKTVLCYEGKNGKFEFRHGGKTTVGFADGHVETVDAMAAKQLVWLPYPGFHPKP